jgi:hypothetical protein
LKLVSDRLNEVTKLRVTAENQAGEARSELVILQVNLILLLYDAKVTAVMQ